MYMPKTYKIYKLGDIAGRVYLWYRDKIWDYYHRALKEGIYSPPRKSRAYNYFKIPVPENMTNPDILALIWYILYHSNLSLIFINAPDLEEAERLLSKLPVRKISRGLNYFIKTIAKCLWITREELLYLAYTKANEVLALPRAKARVTYLEPRLKEIAILEKMKPLEALFAISSLYIAKKKVGVEGV